MDAATCRSRYLAASVLLLIVVLAITPALLFAQRDLAVLHDSLQRIDNPSLLRGMMVQRSGKDAERSPELLTERGLIGLRLYELTAARDDGKAAQKSFEAAIRRAPEYGWAHYGLGLVLTTGPDANPWSGGLRNSFVLDDAIARVFGNDSPTRARRAFLDAISGRPPVSRAAAELADASVRRWDREQIDDAAAALTRLNNSPNATAGSWLAYARVQLELGEVDAAVTSVQRAARLGVDRAEAARTLALVLFHSSNGDKQGAAAWFEALQYADEAALDVLLADVQDLLSKEEAARVEKLDTESRRNYLRTFWDVRAALGGVPVHERIGEHYRRLAIARKQYWRNVRYTVPKDNQLMMRSFGDRPYDDRGVIYIRHGKPLQTIKTFGIDEGNESWVYRGLDGGYEMLHFAAMQSMADYDLIHKVPCDANWLEARTRFDPALGTIGIRCTTLDRLAASQEYQDRAYEYLATDSDRPDFTKDLPFYFDLYTFRGGEGRTNVVAAVAVPVERLQRTEAARNPAYRVDLSLILVDTATRRVIRQDDSVALAATRAFKNDDLFRMHVEIEVPPSKTTVQRVIVSDPSEPGIGQLYGGPFPIPDYSADQLMLSDIVLAEPGVDGRWKRGDVALALVPTGRFKGGAFRVFYEIYNIAQNSAYSTEIEIEPVEKTAGQRIKELFGGKSKISLSFDGVALDVKEGALQELRQVEAKLGPGRYRMRITVRDAGGQTARGERLFIVPD
jgi:tetratricopeptide (TPR) repeat protein